jgi:hypothetical protein
MTFGNRLRAAQLIAAAMLLVTLGCGRAPERAGPSDETLLADGNRELDAIHIPSGWDTAAPPSSGRERGRLKWDRLYRVHASMDDSTHGFDKAATDAGWTRNSDCMGPRGEQCYTYDKGRYHLFPTTTSGPCGDGTSSTCSYVRFEMSPR